MARTLVQLPEFASQMAGNLDPDYFEKKVHRWVVKTAFSHVKKYGSTLEKQELKNYFRNACKAKIFKPNEVDDARAFVESIDRPVKHRDYVRDEVHQFVKNQDVKRRIEELVVCMEEQNFDDIEKIFAEGQRVQNLGFGSLGHFYSRDRDQRLARRRVKLKEQAIPTGIPNFDQYTKFGGCKRKTINVVIAPAGRGKTSVLVHVGAEAVLHGFKVLHISINEVSEEDVADRYDARLAQVQLNELEDPKQRKRIWKRAGQLERRFGETLVIKEFDSTTVAGIEAYVKALRNEGFAPDLISVDYADLITPTVHYDSSYEEQGMTYRELRSLAKRLNVVMWTASQTTRLALNKTVITMADLAESFKKAHVADLMLALCQSKKEKRSKAARFYIGKNRQGGPAEFEIGPMRVDWSRQMIYAA